jgi:hypothetical protein
MGHGSRLTISIILKIQDDIISLPEEKEREAFFSLPFLYVFHTHMLEPPPSPVENALLISPEREKLRTSVTPRTDNPSI